MEEYFRYKFDPEKSVSANGNTECDVNEHTYQIEDINLLISEYDKLSPDERAYKLYQQSERKKKRIELER